MKNLTFGKKISLGFASIITLIVVMGVINYRSANTTQSGFTEYRSAARATVYTSQLQDAVLMLRCYGLGYFNSASDRDYGNIEKQSQSINTLLEGAEESFSNIQNAQLATQLKDAYSQYINCFDAIHSIDDELKELADGSGGMNVLGPQMEQSLSDIMFTATEDGKTDVAYNCALSTRSLMLMRMSAAKFMNQRSKDFEKSFRNHHKQYLAQVEKTRELITQPDRKQAMEQVAMLVANYLESFDRYSQLCYDRQDQVDTCNQLGPRMAGVMDEMKNDLKDQQDTIGPEIAKATAGAKTSVMVLGSIIAVAAILIAGYLVKSLTSILRDIVNRLGEASEQTASASEQVSSSSESLAQGASQAAASIEETASSIEEMSAVTQRNAGNAGEANTVSEHTRDAARNASDAMEQMSRAIADIQSSSDETAKIVQTIDEIAFQTNLLALNAAVEAARAGEAGKGFAVVAEEVRNLAQRSAEAARNTATLIEKSVTSSNNGVKINQQVAEALGEITTNIDKSYALVAEISAASNEQAASTEQISTAVEQIDNVTQSNAANAEETASAAKQLSGQAVQLSDIVAQLQKLIGGNSSTANSSAAATKARPSGTLAASDKVFHNIASDGKKPAPADSAEQWQMDDSPAGKF